MSDDVVSKLQSILGVKFKGKGPNILPGSQLQSVEFVPTGILALDWAWGGGFPMGHGVMSYGAEKCAKTTTGLKITAQVQATGRPCAFIDVENTLDRDWALLHKVDLDNLAIYTVPPGETAEFILDVALETLNAGYFTVLDSVAFLESGESLKKYDEKGMAGKTYAGASGPLSDFSKKVGKILGHRKTGLYLVNQLRDNMSIYGARVRIPGGRALRHMVSIMTEFSQGDFIWNADETEKIGVQIKFYVSKNKVRIPFREKSYELYFSAGINPLKEVVEFAKFYDLVEMRGAWMYYNGEKMGQGANQAMGYLVQNREVYAELRSKIVTLIKGGKR